MKKTLILLSISLLNFTQIFSDKPLLSCATNDECENFAQMQSFKESKIIAEKVSGVKNFRGKGVLRGGQLHACKLHPDFTGPEFICQIDKGQDLGYCVCKYTPKNKKIKDTWIKPIEYSFTCEDDLNCISDLTCLSGATPRCDKKRSRAPGTCYCPF